MACEDMKRNLPIRGFTLVELLVTMGLMALLATVSIGGYYGAVRGMTERGAKQDVVSFLRLARQRALVDQVPTAVIFMNRRLSNEDIALGESARIVGEASAIRRVGRITYVNGNYLSDEFGDLEKTYSTDTGNSSGSPADMRLYRMQDRNVRYSTVRDCVARTKLATEILFGMDINGTYQTNNVSVWAFEVTGGSASWKVGDAYGMEIASIRLPHGSVFGSTSRSQVGKTSDVGSPCFFNPDDASALGVNINFSGIEVRAYTPAKGGQQLQKKFSVSTTDLKDNQ